MALPKKFNIIESEAEIKKLMNKHNAMIIKRLQVLLLFKKNEENGISKREVAELIGVNHNSVQNWRDLYIKGGIKLLISHSKIGFKPSIINNEQNQELKKVLDNPNNGIVGFVELLDWFNSKFKTDINYKTFHAYIIRKFKAKIKVARKSHIQKNDEDVNTFKKTSDISVKPLSKKKGKVLKK